MRLIGGNINATHLTAAAILEQATRLKAIGANHLRWECLSFNLDTQMPAWHCNWSEFDPPDWKTVTVPQLDYNLKLLAEVQAPLEAMGMQLVWDLHWYPGMQRDTSGQCLPAKEKRSMFQYRRDTNQIMKIWHYYARHLKGNPLIAAFDLVNEPNFGTRLTATYCNYIPEVVKEIRAIDPDREIIVETALGAPFSLLSLGDPLLNTPNLTYSFHVYLYKGQNKDWEKRLQPLKDWQTQHGVEIYVGEFGAGTALYPPTSDTARDTYYKAMMTLYQKWGWGHAVWEQAYGDVKEIF